MDMFYTVTTDTNGTVVAAAMYSAEPAELRPNEKAASAADVTAFRSGMAPTKPAGT